VEVGGAGAGRAVTTKAAPTATPTAARTKPAIAITLMIVPTSDCDCDSEGASAWRASATSTTSLLVLGRQELSPLSDNLKPTSSIWVAEWRLVFTSPDIKEARILLVDNSAVAATSKASRVSMDVRAVDASSVV
jgi:hypothetical protein